MENSLAAMARGRRGRRAPPEVVARGADVGETEWVGLGLDRHDDARDAWIRLVPRREERGGTIVESSLEHRQPGTAAQPDLVANRVARQGAELRPESRLSGRCPARPRRSVTNANPSLRNKPANEEGA
jgi:hypothetical protein